MNTKEIRDVTIGDEILIADEWVTVTDKLSVVHLAHLDQPVTNDTVVFKKVDDIIEQCSALQIQTDDVLLHNGKFINAVKYTMNTVVTTNGTIVGRCCDMVCVPPAELPQN